MKCKEKDTNQCQCKTCGNMKNCYCEHFNSDHMCDKCDWKGSVTYCPNKK